MHRRERSPRGDAPCLPVSRMRDVDARLDVHRPRGAGASTAPHRPAVPAAPVAGADVGTGRLERFRIGRSGNRCRRCRRRRCIPFSWSSSRGGPPASDAGWSRSWRASSPVTGIASPSGRLTPTMRRISSRSSAWGRCRLSCSCIGAAASSGSRGGRRSRIYGRFALNFRALVICSIGQLRRSARRCSNDGAFRGGLRRSLLRRPRQH